MNTHKKNLKIYSLFISLLILILVFYFIVNKFYKDQKVILNPISINLLTNVHPNLNWDFQPIKSNIVVKPGEVTTVEYMVKNLGSHETTGIATFAYFPNHFGNYINKINCFCYDAQTLKPNQKNKFTLILLIDPEVTKDSMTRGIKEVTIQFTFFDFKEYKKEKKT